MLKKVKVSRNRPGVAQRVLGGLGSQISWHSTCEGGEVVSLTHRPPLPPGMFLVLIFTRGWVDPRAKVQVMLTFIKYTRHVDKLHVFIPVIHWCVMCHVTVCNTAVLVWRLVGLHVYVTYQSSSFTHTTFCNINTHIFFTHAFFSFRKPVLCFTSTRLSFDLNGLHTSFVREVLRLI
jgi:hypothetical protein